MDVKERIDGLYNLHREAASALGLLERRPFVHSLNRFRRDLLFFAGLPEILPTDEDFIASYGERLSYLLLSGAISRQGINSQPVDATNIIVTNNEYYSADPKKDPSAKFFPDVSYDQAEALARKGAKILHPESIAPLRDKNIPIEVKNFDNPNALGSRIY